ncbi:peptide deformylase [Pelomyxa schiedti]|nr:peptide deformylase [Pelomyxa schiedti]
MGRIAGVAAMAFVVVAVVMGGLLGPLRGASGTVLPMSYAGDPVLRLVAPPYDAGEAGANATQQLAADLADTMAAQGGVGLAAPQVGQSRRMFVAQCEACAGVAPPLPVTVFINPALDIAESFGMPKVDLLEGCLSIPDYRALVPRYQIVTMETLDFSGNLHHMRATGYVAGLLQHEYDHLNGVLYIDKMDISSFCSTDNCNIYFKNAGVKNGTWAWLD